MKAIGIIPARYQSSRFPGKPLALIVGKPMVLWVYERALKASQLNDVIVATDDEKILKTVTDAGGNAMMTSANHETGTERVFEAASRLVSPEDADETVIINIQGDEPLIDPALIDKLVLTFNNTSVQIVTPVRRVKRKLSEHNPHEVKVVKDLHNRALYFSRSMIPHYRNAVENELSPFFIHIGIYAYRFNILEKLVKLSPTSLEKSEKLEQLRWLEHGFEIHAIETDYVSHAVDVPEDIEAIHKILGA